MSRQQHHIIYIPGLGDTKNTPAQRLAVWAWRAYGVYGHCHPVVWSRDEPFEAKLEGVLEEVDELLAAGHIVSLIGSSAGASMALHAYQARKKKIAGVVLICGELGDAAGISPTYFEVNPAFKVSIERLPQTLKRLDPEDRQRIMSLHPLYDEVVSVADTQLEGARMYTSISVGHAVTIALTLTMDFYIPFWFLRKWARQSY